MASDRELTCRDCGSSFVFTAGEQEFYASKGLQHDPVRCPNCRANRKAMRPEDRMETQSYGVFVSWGGRTPRQLHAAVCAECAQTTEVPFLPRGDRPVYCSSCYNGVRERQEADEAAAAERMAAVAAGAIENPLLELEGEGREVSEAAAAEAAAEQAAALAANPFAARAKAPAGEAAAAAAAALAANPLIAPVETPADAPASGEPAAADTAALTENPFAAPASEDDEQVEKTPSL